MKKLILALLMTLPYAAHSQVVEAITVETNSSEQVLSIPGEVFSSQGTIIQRDDDSFAVNISIQYRSMAGKLAHLSYTYDIVNAEFEQNNDDLYLIINEQKYLIAHHEWYYSPAWQLTEGKVKIKSNLELVTAKKIKLNPTLIIYPN